MMALASAGFANTFATNLEELSLKQSVHWSKEEHYDKTHSSNSNLTDLAHHRDTGSVAKLRSGSLTEKVGHKDYRFKLSYSVLVDHLSQGQNIVLSSPVTLIDYSAAETDDRILIHTAPGTVYTTKRVVVTCSPAVLSNPKLIHFKPALPQEKIDALDCVSMYTATKVILTFRTRPWPIGLHGIIMAGTLVPEVWFKEDTPGLSCKISSSSATVSTSPASPPDDTSVETNSSDEDNRNESGTVYMAVGYLSARYAQEASAYDHDTLIEKFLAQLDFVFSHMKTEHLSAEPIDGTVFTRSGSSTALVPSSTFAKGIVYDWATNHPYIGGAYASPKAGKPTNYPLVLAKPVCGSLFFAGEATNIDAGACTHSAVETGLRVAEEVIESLK